MMIDHEIEKLKDGGPTKLVPTIKYIFARDLHINPNELRKMPLCEVIELLKIWQKEQKEIKKQMRKARK